MSVKRAVTKKLVAKLVTEEKGPCAFCQREVDDELIYGKLYAIGNIKCHYFCVLLSCCMVQKGRDEDGLFGFLYPDILAEIERSKKHKCSYCNKEGATLGCCISQCRKQFHLPCGREKNAVSLFYGSYKTFCQNHTPKQKIADNVMAKAKVRMQADRRKMKLIKEGQLQVENDNESADAECVCAICYEGVAGYPAAQTFWPPCCARDAWFHRACLQRMALSAGMHYLKCPLCNDKENFYDAVISQGYYVPDRDAAWELEQNAFADIYERPLHCDEEECRCPMGRGHDSDSGPWDIKLCLVCGSSGAHAQCLSAAGRARLLCGVCRSSAKDLERLADTLEAVIVTEQAQIARAERRPVMPSRMSLRRTKQREAHNSASSSRSLEFSSNNSNGASASGREELNLKPPKRPSADRARVLRDIQNKFTSPTKMLEQLCDKMSGCDVDGVLIEEVRLSFRRPQPLSVKKRMASKILDSILNGASREKAKSKEPVKEWCSPKKCIENTSPSDNASEEVIKSRSPKAVKSPHKSPVHTPSKIVVKFPSPRKSPKTNNNTVTNTDNNPQGNTSLNKTPEKENGKTDYELNKNVLNSNADVETENMSEDESSNSTFQLPPEFVADSDDSLPIFETPKLKTVDIEKYSSLEISENDIKVNEVIDETPNGDFSLNLNVKSPVKTEKCAFKFSPIDKETLQTDNVGLELETFKSRYLNEVGRDFECKFKHNHSDLLTENKSRLKTAIDFAVEASSKRKCLEDSSDTPVKKRKIHANERPKKKKKRVSNGKAKKKNKYRESTDIEVSTGGENLKLSVQGKRKKKKAKVSIRNKEIKLKIQWKKKRVQLQISESTNKKECSKLKQFVLNYQGDHKPMLQKPQFDVTPVKRKYVKQEKSPDNLKQTSIQNFFKVKVPK